MSKLFKNFVGIDISKSWFDATLICTTADCKPVHHQFGQTAVGYQSMLLWLKQYGVSLDDDTLFCMEYTGIYNNGCVNFLVKHAASIWVEMPLRIKKAGGLERGTDDKSASCKIAWYALRYQQQAKLWKPADTSVEQLKHLITQRERIIESIKHLAVPAQELTDCGCIEEGRMISKLQLPAIKALEAAQKRIEAAIDKIIKADEQLNHKVKLVQSVNGIGKVTATALLVYTKGFSAFNNAKELACYCGVVPFTKTSGSSVRYKPSVSPFANMRLKKLLHLCALSAMQNDQEMKAYFNRKLLEGKNKMSIINAIRNKLLHRVFAVIRDDRFYVDKYAAACA